MTSFAINVYADEGELEIQVQWRSNLFTQEVFSSLERHLHFAPNSGVAPLAAAAPQSTSCSSAHILEKDGDGAITKSHQQGVLNRFMSAKDENFVLYNHIAKRKHLIIDTS